MNNAIKKMYTELTRDEAIDLAGSGWWKDLPAKDVALAQLQQPRLCMDFDEFHRVVTEATGRTVFNTELVNAEHLAKEIDPHLPEPATRRKTMAEMMNKKAKVIVVET